MRVKDILTVINCYDKLGIYLESNLEYEFLEGDNVPSEVGDLFVEKIWVYCDSFYISASPTQRYFYVRDKRLSEENSYLNVCENGEVFFGKKESEHETQFMYAKAETLSFKYNCETEVAEV